LAGITIASVRHCPAKFRPVNWRKVGEDAQMARSARHSNLETRTGRARLAMRRAPYFVKVAKGLRLGYYRGSAAGTWIARRYLGTGKYDTAPLGLADDTTDSDGARVLTYFEAQEVLRQWAERRRVADHGGIRKGAYKVADAVRDYLEEIRAEKPAGAVRKNEYIFNGSVLPELGAVLVDNLTTDRIRRWRDGLASRPKRVRAKRTAIKPATRTTPDTEDARRKRKATANRILSMLKAALNRAFHAGRIVSDAAWRKVRPFGRVDEPVIRYLSTDQARRLVNACPADVRRLVQAALLTGCRYSELTRLRCSDFNPDSDTLAIRQSKGGKPRHVVLTIDARKLFLAWTGGRPTAANIFLRDDGETWGASHQQRPLIEASKAAKITPPATFHMLRHTHASHLAMAGTPLGVIAAQLGHADTRMSERHYAHLSPSYVADTIRANLPALGVVVGTDDLKNVARIEGRAKNVRA
jgi:integrase